MGAGVIAEAIRTSTNANAWMTMPNASPGQRITEDDDPAGNAGDIRSGAGDAITGTASPSCNARAEM